MALPFTTTQFFGVFRAYNEAVWPAQVLLLALAVGAVVIVWRRRPWSGRAVAAVLAFLWAWLAVGYHLACFAAINPLAYAFSALSAAGAVAFAWHGVINNRLEFRFTPRPRVAAGVALVLFSLAVYPAWSVHEGHAYPAMPTFGLPCPTTLFTVGMLALMVPPYPRSVVVAPILWCLIGAQAALLLAVAQDASLLAAAVMGVYLLVRSRARQLEPGGHAG